MRFAGHETFSIRDGWLFKGLKLLIDDPEKLHDDLSADFLGVGRNMAKSIRHWLFVTGLAERKQVGKRRSRKDPLVPSDLGRLIYERDRYFSEPGTWWALHVNLVNNREKALAWAWFFNNFSMPRFERSMVVEAFRRHVELEQKRPPSVNTLKRDVACLLKSYARTIPPENVDPEEALDCPFEELRLLKHFRTSGAYEI